MNGPDSPQETIALNAAMLRLFKGEYGDSGLRHSDALFVKEGLEQAEADISALRGANSALVEALEIALKFFSAMPKGESPDGKGGAWDAWTTGMHAIKDALAAHKPAGGGKQSGGTNRAARLREGHPPTAEPDYTSDFRCSGVEPPTNSTSDEAGAKDTARLDWLENNLGKVAPGSKAAKFWILGQRQLEPNCASTVRAAIDAAMSHQPEGGK